MEADAPGFDAMKDTIHVDDPRDEDMLTITIPAVSQPMQSHQTVHTQRYLLIGLLPGRQYEVAIRAKNLFSYTPWTNSFIFQTSRGKTCGVFKALITGVSR